MKDLLQKWLDIKNVERAMKEQREEIEVQLYTEFQQFLKEDSQATFNHDGYKLVIKPNVTVSVDQEKAATRPDLFKVKYDLSWSQFKKSTEKDVLEDMITYKPGKPTFTVTKGE